MEDAQQLEHHRPMGDWELEQVAEVFLSVWNIRERLVLLDHWQCNRVGPSLDPIRRLASRINKMPLQTSSIDLQRKLRAPSAGSQTMPLINCRVERR